MGSRCGQAHVALQQPRCPLSCSRGGDCRREVLTRDAAALLIAWESYRKPTVPPLALGQTGQLESWWLNTIIVRYCCVSLEVVEVVVVRPTVKGGDMSPVVQSSINDAGEEPLGPCWRVWQHCACRGCSPSEESDLGLMFPPAMKGFRREMLPVSAGGDVCRVLKRSSDGRMRPPMSTLTGGSEYSVASILRFHFCNATVHGRMPSPRAAAMEEATHTSRAALRPGTAAVDENVSRPGLRNCEPPGFRGNAKVCQFHAADHFVNTSVVPPRGFGVAAGFCVFQLWVQEGTAASATSHPVFSERW